jgi:hypothetical protein
MPFPEHITTVLFTYLLKWPMQYPCPCRKPETEKKSGTIWSNALKLLITTERPDPIHWFYQPTSNFILASLSPPKRALFYLLCLIISSSIWWFFSTCSNDSWNSFTLSWSPFWMHLFSLTLHCSSFNGHSAVDMEFYLSLKSIFQTCLLVPTITIGSHALLASVSTHSSLWYPSALQCNYPLLMRC